MNRNLCLKIISVHVYTCVLIIAALVLAPTIAFAVSAPTGPSLSLTGTYAVHVPIEDVEPPCEDIILEEKLPGTTLWADVTDIAEEDSIVFLGKTNGVYQYRMHAYCLEYVGDEEEEEEVEWEEVSDELAVRVFLHSGPPPVVDDLVDQLNYEYEARSGDLNGDALTDVFIARTNGGESGNGVLEYFFLLQGANGTLSSIPASSEQASAASGWQIEDLVLTLVDLNLDGFADLQIGRMDGKIPGIGGDYFAFSSGQLFDPSPATVTSVDGIKQLYRDVYDWTDHYAKTGQPDYFEINAVPREGPGHWEYDFECDLELWGDTWEWFCYYYRWWVDGDEYLDYSDFSPAAMDLTDLLESAVQSDALDVNSQSGAGIANLLESVLGVPVFLDADANSSSPDFDQYQNVLRYVHDMYRYTNIGDHNIDPNSPDVDEITEEEIQNLPNHFSLIWDWLTDPNRASLAELKEAAIERAIWLEDGAKEAYEEGEISFDQYLMEVHYAQDILDSAALLPSTRGEAVLTAAEIVSMIPVLNGGGRIARGARMALVRAAGTAGEQAVRAMSNIGNKIRITINGRNRIPDGINQAERIVSEVKNVAHQDFTLQLRDYLAYAKQQIPPYKFHLWTRDDTTFSGPLQKAIDNKEIVLCIIGIGCP